MFIDLKKKKIDIYNRLFIDSYAQHYFTLLVAPGHIPGSFFFRARQRSHAHSIFLQCLTKMPKRKLDPFQDKIEKYKKKIVDLETKQMRKRRRVIFETSSESG